MSSVTVLTFVALCFVLGSCIDGYRPVVFMHGVAGNSRDAQMLFSWIKEAHPETETWSIDMYEDAKSVDNLWVQVSDIGNKLTGYMKSHPDGINLIGYSQGGVICRGILQGFKHNVHTFISLSSPQSGQFGGNRHILFLKRIRDIVYKWAYTPSGQRISVLNYWNDPRHQDLYKNSSVYLALLNNQTINHNSKEAKANFTSLQRLVLIGGPDDGVIIPWQSSLFGFYDKDLNVVDMKHQQWYTEDSFGLQTLDKRGSLIQHVTSGVMHHNWVRNRTVFMNNILPYLG